jgi:hypothetical protein
MRIDWDGPSGELAFQLASSANGWKRASSLRYVAMREVVIIALAAFLIGIMAAALLVHFLP